MKILILLPILVILIGIIPSINAEITPNWVKNTAGWWATDAISEKEFVNAIEFLVNEGIIASNLKCSSEVDQNNNGIVDEIENLEDYSGMSTEKYVESKKKFKNKNWSNCIFPNISHIEFENVDFTNADFSNSRIFGNNFANSKFEQTDFSGSIIHGNVFFKSTFNNVDFTNADFSIDNNESPYVTFTYKKNDVVQYCSFIPCGFYYLSVTENTTEFLTKTFGEKKIPQNLRHVENIVDLSDIRSHWRHVTSFVYSEINNSNFDRADLKYVQYLYTNFTNIDFSESNNFQSLFHGSYLENIKFENESIIKSETLESKLITEKIKKEYPITNIIKYDFSIQDDFNLEFDAAIDDIIINWGMGLLIDDEKLYVADTDNHRIIIYDKNTLEIISIIISPIQYYCDGVNAFTVETMDAEECPDRIRNIPTSIAIIEDLIFVSYGMADQIQVFDMNGNMISQFGNHGEAKGEFNQAYRIFAHDYKIYAADSGNQRIQIFDSKGNFLDEFSTNVNNISNSFPTDIVIFDEMIFVYESNSSSMLIFSMDGTFQNAFHIEGIEKKSLVGFDISHNVLFLTSPENNQIIITDINGTKIMDVGKFGNKYGEFNYPLDIIVDENKIYVSDAKNYRIQIFELYK